MKPPTHLVPVMNDIKWEELRRAVCELEGLPPAFRSKCWSNGFISEWDREWYGHFRLGGYEDIEWFEIRFNSEQQSNTMNAILAMVHVPVETIESGVGVYGYIPPGQFVEFAKISQDVRT